MAVNADQLLLVFLSVIVGCILTILFGRIHRSIRIEGGRVDLDLDESSPNNTKIKISASGLEVTVEHEGVVAELHGVSLDLEEVCFRSGTLDYKYGIAEAETGCVKLDQTEATIETVTIPVELPWPFSSLPERSVELNDVEIDLTDNSFKADSVTYGAMTVVSPRMSQNDDFVVVYAPEIVVAQEWSDSEITVYDVTVTVAKDLSSITIDKEDE